MKPYSLLRIVSSIFVFLIAGWAAIYFAQHFAVLSFQEGAMANLFATILGVVVGIPIALEISNRQQLEMQSERQRDVHLRKKKVLLLLKKELERDKELVIGRADADKKNRTVNDDFLSDVIWSSFSDGGELHCISDSELLSVIAAAYHELRSTIYLERQYMEAVLYPGGKFSLEPQNFYLKCLISKDEVLLVAIHRAVVAIDGELYKSPPHTVP